MSDRDDMTDDDRALVAKLRAMPGEGREPDWNQLAQRIHASLPADVRRPWWRTVLQPRWLAPLLAGAVGIGALSVMATRTAAPHAPIAMIRDAAVPRTDDARKEHGDDVAMSETGDLLLWLDGTDVAVDSTADDSLQVDGLLLGESTERDEGLLTTDDSWVDGLDDADVAAVDHWIDQQMTKKKG